MINIDYSNILGGKIGLQNGINERVLNNFCQKHQSYVKEIWQKKNESGYAFLNLPDDQKTLRKIKNFVSDQKKYKWENIVVLGIGGSALGAIALRGSLLGPLYNLNNKPRLFIVDNIDPTHIFNLLKTIKLSKSLFIVISKSGTTTEPMALYALVKEKLKKSFPKNYQKHFVFVTDPKVGLLRKIAKEEKIKTFDIPPGVIGRFSVLSGVGLLPIAFAGADINGILKGAKIMREYIKKSRAKNNPALLLAAIQFLLDRRKGKTMTVIMPYSNYLFRIGDWYRQLLAESIGKNKRSGPTPITALGTTDQHSQLQLYNEGPNNKLIIFLKPLKHCEDLKLGNILPTEMDFLNHQKIGNIIEAAYQGTAESLTQNKRPNLTINLPAINTETIGALLMLFEFQIAILGLLYKVNAFNQPGVEKSKQITKKIISSLNN